MRTKALVVAVAALVVFVAAPVDAARPPRRAMVPYHYSDQNHHVGGPNFGAGVWNTDDSYSFDLEKGEKAVKVMVLDDNERPVSAVIVQIQWDAEYGNATVGHSVTHHEFCGKTDAPVAVVPDLPVEIFLRKGLCEDGTPSVPTEGDIVVDFRRS